MRPTRMKSCEFLASMGLLLMLSTPAAASVNTYRAGIDLDNDPATGCDFSLGAVAPGTLPGFELQLTVVVDDDPIPAQVSSAKVETCNGAAFADPVALPGFELDLDSGLLASDSIVGSIPASLLGNAVTVRLAFHAQPASGDEDALFTADGTADGAPILFLISKAVQVPALSWLGLALVAALLLGLGWSRSRHRRRAVAASMLFATLAGAAIAYAAFVAPLAVDDPNDATGPDPRAEIIAAFVMQTNSELALRLDIEDFPFETECSDHVDNDFDGRVDCEDGNCTDQSCNDASGCTLDDTCSGFVCLGTPVNCATIVGNECSDDACVSVSADEFKCNSRLRPFASDFGSCTPEGNCVTRNPDGTCSDRIDDCIVGRCIEQAGVPPSFVCEAALKVGVHEPVGCEDGNSCTSEVCSDGDCLYTELDDVSCDDGNDCTVGDTCHMGNCEATFADNTKSCDDRNDCTDNDLCDGSGSCVGTPDDTNTCDDGNDCTTETCVSGGCQQVPVAGHTQCDSGVACATKSECSFGDCVPTELDDSLCVTDDTVCTQQVCTSTGCMTTLMNGPMPCEVENGECLVGRQMCSQGAPVGGCVANAPPEPCP